jgi:hypothetical protein
MAGDRNFYISRALRHSAFSFIMEPAKPFHRKKKAGTACSFLQSFIDIRARPEGDPERYTPFSEMCTSFQAYLSTRTTHPEVLALATKTTFQRQLAKIGRTKGWGKVDGNPPGWRVKMLRPVRTVQPSQADITKAIHHFLQMDPPPTPQDLGVAVVDIPRVDGQGVVAIRELGVGHIVAE